MQAPQGRRQHTTLNDLACCSGVPKCIRIFSEGLAFHIDSAIEPGGLCLVATPAMCGCLSYVASCQSVKGDPFAAGVKRLGKLAECDRHSQSAARDDFLSVRSTRINCVGLGLWFAKIPNMLRMRDLRLTSQVLNQMT